MATLFDDASLVMIPSGYKDDKLYSIKPVERLGSELTTNGDFSGGTSNWTASNATLSIESGALKITSTGGNRPQAYQTITGLTVGKNYRLTAVAKRGTTANAVEIEISGIGHPTNSNKNFTTEYATLVAEFTATSTTHTIQAKIDDGAEPVGTTAFFQSVSMKEIIANGDFTFSRDGSGASPATRVNSAGLIEKGRTNLLLQSNTFSNASWTKYGGVTLTSGQSGYDGTNDAWKLTKPASGFTGIGEAITISGVITLSVYVKSDTHTKFTLRLIGTPDVNVIFNLSNGTIFGGSSSGWIDRKIESVGNDWYKCSLTLNNTGTTNAVIYPDEITNTTAGSIYIQDAQLEKGLVATSVIETTTAAASAGILGDMPRLDYSGGATCPSLLLEPARTNLVTYSEYFEHSSWAAGATTADISKSPNLSPEGVANCYYVENVSGSQLGFYTTITSGASYTGSFWVRKVSGTGVVTMIDVNNSGTDFNVGTEWTRVSVTATSTSTIGRCYIRAQNTGDIIEVYGAQLEAGSYPTSYVPTYGSATTRAKDHFLMLLETAGITSSGQTEATLFIEFEKPNTGENVDLMRFRGTGVLGRGYIYNNGAGFASDWGGSSLNFTIGENVKAVWRVNSLTDGEVFVNGTKSNNGTGTAWSGFYTIRFNEEGGGGVLKIKQIALFNTALTDAECISLTT